MDVYAVDDGALRIGTDQIVSSVFEVFAGYAVPDGQVGFQEC